MRKTKPLAMVQLVITTDINRLLSNYTLDNLGNGVILQSIVNDSCQQELTHALNLQYNFSSYVNNGDMISALCENVNDEPYPHPNNNDNICSSSDSTTVANQRDPSTASLNFEITTCHQNDEVEKSDALTVLKSTISTNDDPNSAGQFIGVTFIQFILR